MADNITLDSSRLGSVLNDIDLGPTMGSVQLQFAKLQMEQAQLCKDQATKYMDQIKQAQDEQKKCADMIALARKCQNQGKSGEGVGMKSIDGVTTKGSDCYPMPKELVDYMDAHDLLYSNSDKDHILGKDEWTQAIESLTKHQETIGTNTQVANAGQVLASIARGQ